MRLNYSSISTPNDHQGAGDYSTNYNPIGIPNFLGFDHQIQWRPQLQLHQTTSSQPSPSLLGTSSARLLGNNSVAVDASSYNIAVGQIQKKMEATKMEEDEQQRRQQQHQVNLGKPFWGVVAGSDRHYWGGFNPSSSSPH